MPLLFTCKVVTMAQQAAPFVVGMPGDSSVAGFSIAGTTWTFGCLKDTQGTVRPRAFVVLADGGGLPSIGCSYTALPLWYTLTGTGAVRILIELKPLKFQLDGPLTQAEADALGTSVGETIPQMLWDQTMWKGTL